jgi:hypothetical protein
MVISISAPDKLTIVVFSILSNDQAGLARCHFSQFHYFFCLTEGFGRVVIGIIFQIQYFF